MRLCWKGWIAALLLARRWRALPRPARRRRHCSRKIGLRWRRWAAAWRLPICSRITATLQAELLPSIALAMGRHARRGGAGCAAGEGRQGAAAADLSAGCNSAATETTDMQFFCSNANGSLTVTISMHALPPGKYAVVLADAAGAPLGGQMGLIAVWDPTGSPGWKLGGVSVRQGIIDGHDGVWYWTRARTLAATGQPWSAWYSYDLARYLLLPVDFLSSPNLEKLCHEQSQIKDPPGLSFRSRSVMDRDVEDRGVRIDTSLRQSDLGVTYESLGMTTQRRHGQRRLRSWARC